MGAYLRPRGLEEALQALTRPFTVLAGGTDFYPARVGRAVIEDVLDIAGIAALRGISETAAGWRLGATTTWSELVEADLPPMFDGLKQAAREVGGRQIQNAGTIAGNICNASPAADGVPALLALDAEVELASRDGARRLPLASFITGVRTTAREPGELVVALHVPRPRAEARSAFLKLGARRYLVISIAMASTLVEVDGREGQGGARRRGGLLSRCATLAGPGAGACRRDGRRASRRTARAVPSGAAVADRRCAGQCRLSQRGGPGPAAPAVVEGRRMKLEFTLNGRAASWDGAPVTRLASALRDDLGVTGTKIGCDAGDCGACTVLLDGRQVCSCLVAMGQIEGRTVETVEGLEAGPDAMAALQQSFLDHGAAQCGICTPGMLMAAQELVRRNNKPSRAEVEDFLGGVLCRCTGYGKIVDAVMDVVAPTPATAPAAGEAVGSRIVRVDGPAKVTGRDLFGADTIPRDALWIRVVRSPHARARFVLGDLEPLRRRLAAVLTAADVPFNGYGIYPDIKDQPVLADGQVRYRGEAVARPGRRTCRGAGDPRRRGADHLDARAAGVRRRCRDGRRCAAGPGRQAGQPAAEGRREARRCGRRLGCLRRRGGRHVRDRLRRARLYRAGGRLGAAGRRPHRDPCDHADALHGPRRDREPDAAEARGRAHRADRLRWRLRRQARPVGAAAARHRGLDAGTSRGAASTRGPKAWPPAPSAIRPA